MAAIGQQQTLEKKDQVMITKENAPVEWALLISELEDAKEHLSTFIEDIRSVRKN